MKKFVFVYHGTMSQENISQEDMKRTMDKWMAWFGTFKDQMVDGGNPFAPMGKAVSAQGVETVSAAQHPATGYTIINAKDIEEASVIAKGCPILENKGSVHVYEALPM